MLGAADLRRVPAGSAGTLEGAGTARTLRVHAHHRRREELRKPVLHYFALDHDSRASAGVRSWSLAGREQVALGSRRGVPRGRIPPASRECRRELHHYPARRTQPPTQREGLQSRHQEPAPRSWLERAVPPEDTLVGRELRCVCPGTFGTQRECSGGIRRPGSLEQRGLRIGRRRVLDPARSAPQAPASQDQQRPPASSSPHTP